MNAAFLFIFNSILLGLGLSADAFSLSVVNGSCMPHMKRADALLIAGSFSFFQALMPMTGWFLTRELISCFTWLAGIIPRISRILLIYLGIKIILDGKKDKEAGRCHVSLRPSTLFFQSVATSIDALLVGLGLSEYSFFPALTCSLIIAAVTFLVCFTGVKLGKLLGTKLLGRASILGGTALILLGAENFIRSIIH